uniref:Endoplasmic reticulum transmembrane protein n=1 Tax=Riptortus pedestris TaxID=329032 RepID=R4WPR3_RIPPE|nr:bcr-associated protein, bap [Riptortus pedestris]
MSLQWTLVAGFLYGEMAIILLFIAPFISAKTWQRFFRSRFLQVVSQQATWYFAIIFAILALLFLDAIREMRKYSGKEATEHAHLESELQISMRLFRAQRNFYISGFALFLSLVIKRLASLNSKQAQLLAENEAALKQAKSATTTARTLLNNQGAGEDAQNTSNEAHQVELNKLQQEIEAQKKEIESLKKDKEAVVSQAKSLEKEYDRLTEEHRKLQLKVNVSGESKKDE